MAAVLAWFTIHAPPAQADPPNIGPMLPGAAKPGAATVVTFYGNHLQGPAGLWTSFPATTEIAAEIKDNGSKPDHVAYRFTLPDSAPVGIGGVRLATGTGISNLRLIMIDDLPSVTDNGKNKTPAAAQAIKLPVAVDGTCEPESVDVYAFDALAGQRISVEVVARRLGWPLDSVIRLLDASGRELAYSDDAEGIAPDSRLVHVFEAPGRYFLEIRDIRYQGGGGYRYRLRIGDFPCLTGIYPLGGTAGATLRITPMGPDAPDVPSRDLAVPPGWGDSPMPVSFRYPNGQGSSFVDFAVSGLRSIIEFEPNDAPEQASPVVLPAAINGRFQHDRDRDYFSFEAKANQRFRFVGVARTLGSPADLFMRIFKADGTKLAEVDDSGPREGVLDFKAPADGTYRLMVEDLNHRGGPEFGYRVEVRPDEPGFSLLVEASRLNAPRAGVFVTKVKSARREYNGPITLELQGAGDGFRLQNNVIPKGKNETQLRVTVPASLKPSYWRVFQVVGKAKIKDRTYVARAHTVEVLRKQFAELSFPPAVLDGQIGLGIGPPFPDFFKLTVEGGPVRFPQLVGTATLKVKAERLNKFADPINLAVENLPAGITAEVKPIAKGKNDIAITLRGPTMLAEGKYRFRIVGTASFQNQPKRVAIDNIALDVVPPIAITTEACQLAQGATHPLKLSLVRYASDKSEVKLSWGNLPVGVRISGAEVIPADANELVVKVETSPAAPVGRYNQIRLVAQSTVQGRQVSVENNDVSIEVTAATAKPATKPTEKPVAKPAEKPASPAAKK